MNERILELEDQCWVQVPCDFDMRKGGLSTINTVFDREKFARLIAKECAQLAMTEHHSTSPADYDEMAPYEQGCDDTASAISGKIRRIFGVE